MTVREYVEDKIKVREVRKNGKRIKEVIFPEKRVFIHLPFDISEDEINEAKEKIIQSLETVFEIKEDEVGYRLVPKEV